MNIEYTIPFTLTSPKGTLDFNAAAGGSTENWCFLLDQTRCKMGPIQLRTTADDNPQGDGGVLHRGFRSLAYANLGFQYWIGAAAADRVAACGEDLREMYDTLSRHMAALVSPSQGELDAGLCRLTWTPSGAGARMLDRIQVLAWPDPAIPAEGPVADAFSVHSPFPYAMDLAQTVTALGPTSGTTVTVNNAGTAPFYPVFRVHGPCATFFISNLTTGLDIFYNSIIQPGAIAIPGGSYAEIDVFRNTIYMNGNGSNLKAGIGVEASDFFPLVVGNNILQTDAPVDMLWQSAWA